MDDLIKELKSHHCITCLRKPCDKHMPCEFKRHKKIIKHWLSSFNTDSATKCFEAVNILKERLEDEVSN